MSESGGPSSFSQGAASSSVPSIPQPSLRDGPTSSMAPSQSFGAAQSHGRSVSQLVSQRMGSQPTPAQFRGSVGGITPGSVRRIRGDLGRPSFGLGRSMSAAPSSTGHDDDEDMEDEDDGEGQTVVWGTNIHVPTLCRRIRRFLRNFEEEGAHEPKYLALLRQMGEDGESVLNIDCNHIYAFDQTLYGHLVSYPAEVTTLLDSEASQLFASFTGTDPDDQSLVTKPFNLMETKVIRDLNPSDINKLISVSGMITRTSNIIPDLRTALFSCEVCSHEEWRQNDRGRVEEPKKCTNPECNTAWSMKLIHNRCAFYNKQIVKMQENPNAIPEGETPHAVTMLCFDEMVDTSKPGDRVTVTGIYKAIPMRVNPRLRTLKSVYKTHIDILHVMRDEKSKLFTVSDNSQEATDSQEVDDSLVPGEEMTREQQEAKQRELENLSKEPDIYEKLVASIAPSIWQLEDVKKGILCQLFGGGAKEFSGGKVRGELNVLLVGDPGVSKSQLLTYVNKVAPRGLYTSGRGSSAVGLTAYVTKDPETREMVLESGALVLSDRGICCIDEFDKMSESARSMLHEVMEQQTVSVAKAGIIATLNARTSVLASANPVGSRYNPRLSVIDNIHLPPSLLSRFDLIYLVLDKAQEASDRKLARHLVSLYYEEQDPSAQSVIPMGKLKDYIAFARTHCHPQLTDAAAEELVTHYLQMRRAGSSRKVITATPRQLESMVRIAEALAKMRLSSTVESNDVLEAVRLMKVAMQQSATDPTTGAIDMDIIQTGVSHSDRVARQQLAQELKNHLARAGNGLTLEELLQRMQAQSSLPVEASQIRDALQSVSEEIIHEGTKYRHRHAVEV